LSVLLVDSTDLCDDDEMRQAVLSLLSEIQHKQFPDLQNHTAERHSSSLRRYRISFVDLSSGPIP